VLQQEEAKLQPLVHLQDLHAADAVLAAALHAEFNFI
jgi:hypothetical protein